MGRTLHLWLDRDDRYAVQGLNAPAPISTLECVQDEVLDLVIHELRHNPGYPSRPEFREQPGTFAACRASIVSAADAPPARGTFKLKVGAQTTSAITWPADLSTTNAVTTFKAAVLAAIKALSNVGANGVVADDPSGAVPHFLYFRWTNLEREDLIEIVENRLIPATEYKALGSLASAGFTQLLKFTQLPYKTTADFDRPSTPSAQIIETQPGATGVNEEQVLIIPAEARGALALIYSGAQTKGMDVSTITATLLAGALNAVVVDGATNPSFAVEARSAVNGGKRFAIQFIGPLAGAAQTELGLAMLDQVAWPYAIGSLDLRNNPGIEQLLNGGPRGEAVFELTLDEAEKYVFPLTITNSPTGPDTLDVIAATPNGIIVIDRPVYVDNTTADPFVTATAGLSFDIPSGGGSSFNFQHLFNDLLVGAYLFNRTDDSPETWRLCGPGEFSAESNGLDHTIIRLPFTLVDDEDDPLYRGLWKVRLVSLNAALLVNTHEHTWAQIRESLPSGQTLTAKLAAIDAALGVVGGALQVAAANITGTLKPSQIDLSSLASALVGQSTFTSTFISLLKSNTELVSTFLTQITNNSNFAQALQDTINSSTPLVDAIGAKIGTSASFETTLRKLVYDVIQSTGSVPEGATVMLVDEVLIIVPDPQEILGPSIVQTLPVTQNSQSGTDETNKTSTTRVIQEVISTPTKVRTYAALSPALTGLTTGGTKTGKLAAAGYDLTKYYTVTGEAQSRNARARRGQVFYAGDVIAFGAGHWYKVVDIGGVHFPVECEQELVTFTIDAAELFAGSQFAADLPTLFQLAGNALGTCVVILEQAPYTVDSGGTPTLAGATFTQVFADQVHLSPVTRTRRYQAKVTRAANGTLTGEYKIQGRATSFTPTAASMILRFRISKFDADTSVTDPRGSLTVRIPESSAAASIVAL